MDIRNILGKSGRLDSVTTTLSRHIVPALKNTWHMSGQHSEIFFMYMGESELDVELNIRVTKRMVKGWDFQASATEDGIELQILLQRTYDQRLLNNIIAELKETLQHELEHFVQFNRTNIWEDADSEGIRIGMVYYLLSAHEVPAYVKGLYKRAKYKRMPLDKAFDEFYNEHKQQLSVSDWNMVKRTWTEYAKKHLPKAQWS